MSRKISVVSINGTTMATLTYYFDTRSGSGRHPLKLRITHKQKSIYIGTGIKLTPEQWDETSASIINHDKADTLNPFLVAKKKNADAILLKLELNGLINDYSVADLKAMIENNGIKPVEEKSKKGEFVKVFYEFAESRNKEKTKNLYRQSIISLRKYDPLLDIRTFEDVNLKYIQNYESWMIKKEMKQNSRYAHIRNIRAVFNYAIEGDITTLYPFRKYKFKKVRTKYRSLTVDELRMLRDYPCSKEQKKYVDLFFLMFYLIGINAADLLPAKKNQVYKGRLEYDRAKTGKPYSIKIEPEAQALIDKYKGTGHLLYFCDTFKTYEYVLHRLGKMLKSIGPYTIEKHGKKTITPLFPDISQYWCRHTWATLAGELDIPKETIAAAMGHDMGNPTTAIYINFNQKKVDEANRKIIDFLNEK